MQSLLTHSGFCHRCRSPCNLVFVHLVVAANLFVRRQPGVRQSNQRRIGHEYPIGLFHLF